MNTRRQALTTLAILLIAGLVLIVNWIPGPASATSTRESVQPVQDSFGQSPTDANLEDSQGSLQETSFGTQQITGRITKQGEAASPLCPGSHIGYTVTLYNESAAGTAPVSASIRDPIPDDTFYVEGSATGGATYNADADQIEWEGELASSESVTITFTVQVETEVPNGTDVRNWAQGRLGQASAWVGIVTFVNCPAAGPTLTPSPTPTATAATSTPSPTGTAPTLTPTPTNTGEPPAPTATPTATSTPSTDFCTDWRVSLNSNVGLLWPGTATTRTMTVLQVTPANATWTFAAENVPADLTVAFTPPGFTGTASTQVYIGAGAEATPGDYTLRLRPYCNGFGLPAFNFHLQVVSSSTTVTPTPTATNTQMPSATPATTTTPTATSTPTSTPTSTTEPTYANTVYLALLAHNRFSSGPVGEPDATPTVTATSVPTETPPTMPSATPVTPTPIYSDDFSDPSSGWRSDIVSGGIVGYQDGEYRTWARPIINGSVAGGFLMTFTDFDVEVSARALNPPISGAYLLLFHHQDDLNYYYYRVSPSTQSYSLYKVVNDAQTQLVAPTESSAILTGTATNRLRVTVEGSAIRLYVNDQFLTEVDDAALASGNFLLGAWNFADIEGTTIHWDDFVVYGAGARPMSAGGNPPLVVRP